jgi:hypothetical protein
MANYQGIGEVSQFGQHLSTVKYSIETDPLEGEIETDEGERYLSKHDRFTLHMQGGMRLVFRVTQVVDGVMGKYYIKGIGSLSGPS